MSITLEALVVGAVINTAGWLIAGYCVKRWADAVSRDLKALGAEIRQMVSLAECRDIHNRLHVRCDKMDAKIDNHGERLAGVEVAAGK